MIERKFLVSAAAIGWLAGAAALPAGALEISLEENRAEHGTVGFVDIKRVFDEFPETRKAKESFEGEIAKRDKQLQAKKAEIRALRRQISELEAERSFVEKGPIGVSSAPAVSTAAAAPQSPQSPAPIPVQTLPGMPTGVAASTGPASAPAVRVSTPAAAAVSTAPVAASAPPVAVSTAPAAAAPSSVDSAMREARLKLLDSNIAKRRQELANAESDLHQLSAKLEKELANLESAKSRTLLGRIYEVIQDLAREEGVSIVLEKGSILYGQQAVDLTDKLIQRLKESS